ncbi:hypothetical protein [Parafrankia sp. EUN1f]|uniref:Cas10/Cmr2 second palm domain-containing protein n=1 Tax=Parafrankia sp. EUN1f TaxID=102897 RepID=UPI0001C46408|nr:hypothetical protein [Parafrankia sp. EUN1f]EFC81114.1 hypothetical protein FrEUN1fDRAFT_5775 [Parafrankia sp. EUN1f]
MGDRCFLVHLETSAKQRFIFDTTKRRENVGASELIYRLGVWTREALGAGNATGGLLPGFRPAQWSIGRGDPAELLTEAGGAVSVLVRDADAGRALVTEVTRRALHEAPGLDVCGVLSSPFEWNGAEEDEFGRVRSPLALRAAEVRRLLPRVRSRRPGPVARFARIPVVASCAASGLPACDVVPDGDGVRVWQARSASSLAKRDHRQRGYERLAEAAGINAPAVAAGGSEVSPADVVRAISDLLGDTDDWVAVIHADGNSLGELFRNLDLRIVERDGSVDCATYARELKALSAAVDTCTRAAFRVAFGEATRRCPPQMRVWGNAPVLPLVLGGDDLTVLCLGDVSLPFLSSYLTAFEEETRNCPDIAALLPEGLTACAGLAAVKSHFPFSDAHELAGELAEEAKRAVKAHAPQTAPAKRTAAAMAPSDGETSGGGRGRPTVSALSFHVVTDSTASTLRDLRRALTIDGTSLVAQPYVTTPGATGGWLHGRHYDDLCQRVALITDRSGQHGAPIPDGLAHGESGGYSARERALPASQLHELREALFSGAEVARGLFQQMLPRYGSAGLREIGGPDGDLFFDVDPPPAGTSRPHELPTRMTGLLDAMAAVDLMHGGVA